MKSMTWCLFTKDLEPDTFVSASLTRVLNEVIENVADEPGQTEIVNFFTHANFNLMAPEAIDAVGRVTYSLRHSLSDEIVDQIEKRFIPLFSERDDLLQHHKELGDLLRSII